MQPVLKQFTKILYNLIRIGKVDSVNPAKGTVRVVFEDKDHMTSNDLPLVSNEYQLPPIGEQVLCIFLPNGIQEGFCLGSFYSGVRPPPTQNEEEYVKKLDEGVLIRYNKGTKNLSIDAPNGLTINGNLHVSGVVTSGGGA